MNHNLLTPRSLDYRPHNHMVINAQQISQQTTLGCNDVGEYEYYTWGTNDGNWGQHTTKLVLWGPLDHMSLHPLRGNVQCSSCQTMGKHHEVCGPILLPTTWQLISPLPAYPSYLHCALRSLQSPKSRDLNLSNSGCQATDYIKPYTPGAGVQYGEDVGVLGNTQQLTLRRTTIHTWE